MRCERKIAAAALLASNTIQGVSAVSGQSAIAPLANVICEIFGKLVPTSTALMIAAYAALLWIYSREEPAMRERAKKMFVLVAAGLIIVNLAEPLVTTLFPDLTNLCP